VGKRSSGRNTRCPVLRLRWPGGPGGRDGLEGQRERDIQPLQQLQQVQQQQPLETKTQAAGKTREREKRRSDGQRLCCWSATKTQSAKQPVDRQLRQLHAQPARSSQSTPPPTWRARRRNRMRARVRRRPPEGRRLPSSAGLAGRPGPSMAWRAGGRSCPAAAERSTQSAQRRGASVA
jgi:hypothetical protein